MRYSGLTLRVVLVVAVFLLVGCDVFPTPTVSPLVDGSPEGGGLGLGDFDVSVVLQWLVDHVEEAALVAGLIVSLISGGVKKAQTLAVALMLEAEKIAKDEVKIGGPEKMQLVINRFLTQLPADARAIIRVWATFRGYGSLEAFVAELAQRWYDAAIDA